MCAGVLTCKRVWLPEVSIWNLMFVVLHLSFWDTSSHWTWSLVANNWLPSPRDLPDSTQETTTTPGLYMGTRVWIQILIFKQKALYPLSHVAASHHATHCFLKCPNRHSALFFSKWVLGEVGIGWQNLEGQRCFNLVLQDVCAKSLLVFPKCILSHFRIGRANDF